MCTSKAKPFKTANNFTLQAIFLQMLRESLLVEHDEKHQQGMGAEFTMDIIGMPQPNIKRQVGGYHEMIKYGEKVLLFNRRGNGGRTYPTS